MINRCLTVCEKYLAVSNLMKIHLYYANSDAEQVLDLFDNSVAGDYITDITSSADSKLIALLTVPSKKLVIYSADESKIVLTHVLPRAASKIRFTNDSKLILVADKTGDALLYSVEDVEGKAKIIVGHLSLLLDVLMTIDQKYVITCDRDEKIRVSNYPNTYNIKTYCLGHKEFVKSLELLPHNHNYIISASGDSTVRIWDYTNGTEAYIIRTSLNVEEQDVLKEFSISMDEERVEVNCLPILQMSTCKNTSTSSLIATSILNVDKILIYEVSSEYGKFEHSLKHTVNLDSNPIDFMLFEGTLWVCLLKQNRLHVQKLTINGSCQGSVNDFRSIQIENTIGNLFNDGIKTLYKRKFDNVQEYQERKRQRLELKNKDK